MADRPKVSRRKPVYSAEELFLKVPEQELQDYERQRIEYNRTVPRDKQYYGGYTPDELGGALGLIKSLVGTNAGKDFFDYVNSQSKFSFGDPRISFDATGEISHESPSEILLRKYPSPATAMHEAAHSDSLLSGKQPYVFGNRAYPGYGELLSQFAALMPEDEYYKRGDYGGAEEDAARLRAAYAMQPEGTSVADYFKKANYTPRQSPSFFGSKKSHDTSNFYDYVGPGEFAERKVRHPDEASALKLLEHTLFPRKRFIEQGPTNEPGVTDKIIGALNQLKSLVGDWYESKVKK